MPRRSESSRRSTALPPEHACAGCPVRLESFCGVLDPEALGKFKALGAVSRLHSGALFHEGDTAAHVFNLTRGTLKLYRLLPDGRRQITGFVHPGEFLGICFEGRHVFTCEAVEPAEYCRFPRARFEAFAEAHAEVERALYGMAAHELRAAQEQMVMLGRKTAAERLATFLKAQFDRVASGGGDPEVLRLPMTQVDIADYLGLTKETVSRVLSRLCARRIVRRLAGERMELIDRPALEALAAGSEPA